MTRNIIVGLAMVLAGCMAESCREVELVSYVEDVDTGSRTEQTPVVGLYVLNEGNMGSNKCTLDYLDLSTNGQTTSHYYRNIYGDRNPNTVLELGDVGNDIEVYGSKLWMVINCSNKVEVCAVESAKRIGQVNIPNCRYLAFDQGYAYVSSYAGPVQLDGESMLGRVYKVDTLSLQVVDSLTVGYQPEEMAIYDGRLYVANSGGYQAPNYDNRVSVIDLSTFAVEKELAIGINLHRIAVDRRGTLWISSRGDYQQQSARLYWLTAEGEMGYFDRAVTAMALVGDSLYCVGSTFSYTSGKTDKQFSLIDVEKHKIVETPIFDASEITSMHTPYGIVVNPIDRDFYLMDAMNYVTSGELLHFRADGSFDWKVRTGDIPSAATFVTQNAHVEEQPVLAQSPYIEAVDEYVPAPGQFVNELPKYEDGDDALTMARKCTEAIANNAGGLITLGAWGGYVTFHFDHPVQNFEHERDIYLIGNATQGSSEAGIVMVSCDTNSNGLPDDQWYELSGSADLETPLPYYGYELTYTREGDLNDIRWEDNHAEQGTVKRNAFHSQEYFPQWLSSPLTFSGTRLPNNAHDDGSGKNWVLDSFGYGYADNARNKDTLSCSVDIGWAVEPITRKPVHLDEIHFVRIYTGLNQDAGWLGETSTEVRGAMDLHYNN